MLFLNLLLSAVSIHPFHFLLFFLLYCFFPDFCFPVSVYLGSRKEMDLLCFITSCCHLVVCWGPQRLQQTPVQNYWNTWKHISILSGQESKLSHLVTFVPSPKAPFLLPATKAVISSWKAACFVPKFSAENCKCKTNFPGISFLDFQKLMKCMHYFDLYLKGREAERNPHELVHSPNPMPAPFSTGPGWISTLELPWGNCMLETPELEPSFSFHVLFLLLLLS